MKFSKALVFLALLAVIGSSSLPIFIKSGSSTPVKWQDDKGPDKGGALTQDYG